MYLSSPYMSHALPSQRHGQIALTMFGEKQKTINLPSTQFSAPYPYFLPPSPKLLSSVPSSPAPWPMVRPSQLHTRTKQEKIPVSTYVNVSEMALKFRTVTMFVVSGLQTVCRKTIKLSEDVSKLHVTFTLLNTCKYSSILSCNNEFF